MKLIFLLSLILPFANAHDSGQDIDNPSKEDLIKAEKLVSDKYGAFTIVLRKDGPSDGLPYVLEVRPNCSKTADRDWKKIEVAESLSGCKIEFEKVKFEKASDTLVIRYFDADADAYNRESRDAVRTPKMRCETSRSTLKIDLAELCSEKLESQPSTKPAR